MSFTANANGGALQEIRRTYYFRSSSGANDVTFYINDQLPTDRVFRIEGTFVTVTPRTGGTITASFEIRLYGAFSTERIYDAVSTAGTGTSPLMGGYILLGYIVKGVPSGSIGDGATYIPAPPTEARGMMGTGAWRVVIYDPSTGTLASAAKFTSWGLTVDVRSGGPVSFVN